MTTIAMKYSPYIRWAKEHHDVPFNLAGSGLPAFPLSKLTDDPASVLESGSHEDGWPPLIKRIAARYEVDTDQVVTVSSASMANHLVCALLLDPGDEVMVEDPTYEPLVSVPQYLHCAVTRFDRSPDNGYQPDISEIVSGITDKTKLIMLSDMHNPSGIKLKPKILRDLSDLAEKNNLYILVDEVYLEFMYPQGERTAARVSERIITTRSLTKAFGLDDVRIGWILAPASLAKRLQRLKDLFTTTLPFPSERLGAAALDQADKMLADNLQLLQSNVAKVQEFIESQPKLSWVQPGKGSVGFVKFSGGSVNLMVELALEKYQTIVVPGRFFGRPDYFRIGWGIPENILMEGLERLAKAIADL